MSQKLTKADKKKLSTRKGMLDYIAYCRYKEGMAWFHNKYVTNKKKTDKELKLICKDYLINFENGIQYLKESGYHKLGYDRSKNGYWKKG